MARVVVSKDEKNFVLGRMREALWEKYPPANETNTYDDVAKTFGLDKIRAKAQAQIKAASDEYERLTGDRLVITSDNSSWKFSGTKQGKVGEAYRKERDRRAALHEKGKKIMRTFEEKVMFIDAPAEMAGLLQQFREALDAIK